jgi:Zn finger protein HypA/HybF involved in hydrogenase expression
MNSTDIHIKTSDKKCSCPTCNNPADTFLEIVLMPKSGFFCHQCATDIKWHGIGEEIIQEHDLEVETLEQERIQVNG